MSVKRLEKRVEKLKSENAELKRIIKLLKPSGRCGECHGDWEECGCLCEYSGFRRMVCSCCNWKRKAH